ncbi:MAG: HPr kinase/phosphatase C-terminal domain-containing protein [Pseudomonadota bacterium]
MSNPTIHATAVLVGEGALLVRGPSGSGKSFLALELLRQAKKTTGIFVRLIADDRVHLEAINNMLVARAPKKIAGMIEQRYHGVQTCPYETHGIVRAVLDLDEQAQRMPDHDQTPCEIHGIKLSRFVRPPRTMVSLAEALSMTHTPALNR